MLSKKEVQELMEAYFQMAQVLINTERELTEHGDKYDIPTKRAILEEVEQGLKELLEVNIIIRKGLSN